MFWVVLILLLDKNTILRYTERACRVFCCTFTTTYLEEESEFGVTTFCLCYSKRRKGIITGAVSVPRKTLKQDEVECCIADASTTQKSMCVDPFRETMKYDCTTT